MTGTRDIRSAQKLLLKTHYQHSVQQARARTCFRGIRNSNPNRVLNNRIRILLPKQFFAHNSYGKRLTLLYVMGGFRDHRRKINHMKLFPKAQGPFVKNNYIFLTDGKNTKVDFC